MEDLQHYGFQQNTTISISSMESFDPKEASYAGDRSQPMLTFDLLFIEGQAFLGHDGRVRVCK
jgi:hypothetical protein